MKASKYDVLLFLFIGIFLFTACNKKRSDKKAVPPNVNTSVVQQKDVPIYIDTIGQVIPPVTVNIRPQVAGKLIKAYIQQGSLVEEGEVLYEMDPRPYQAILDQALAQLAHDQALLDYAEKAVERYKKVVEEDFISKLTFEQYESSAAAARAQVELDKAAVNYAQINLDYCKVVAPVAGKISYFNVDVGNILVVDDPVQITVIRPFFPIDIIFSLPQQQFEMIRREQGDDGEWKFIATLPENPTTSFDGITYFIDNQINQNTGTILLKGRLPNRERQLWPGEFVRIKVLYKVASNAFTVPPGAVLIGKEGHYIYTVNSEGKAEVKKVEILTRTEEFTAFSSNNVHQGETVIVEGQINVAPGIVVHPVKS